MDAERFDALSRCLASPGSRRHLFGAFTGLHLAGLLTVTSHELTTAARARKATRRHTQHHQRRASRRRQQERRSGGDTHGAACIPTGQKCPIKKPRGKKGKTLRCAHCCQGLSIVDAGGTRRCGCTPAGGSCTAAGASQCCTGRCDGTTCQAGGSPTCAETCPGCCDSNGSCQAGTSPTACGRGGSTCATCAGPQAFCENQTCAGCTSSSQCAGNAICAPSGLCVACDVCQPVGACTYDTVQAAVDPGGPETIHICPGLYTGAVSIERPVSLIGAGDDDAAASNTILQGTDSAATVSTEWTFVPSFTLRGLRITGGKNGVDAGVSGAGGLATIRDCTITGNTGFTGLSVEHGPLVAIGCIISANSGSGISILMAQNVTLINCLVTGHNNNSNVGGGIACDGILTLDNTVVSSNTAIRGGGILISPPAGEAHVTNGSQITGNSADIFGGGIQNLGILTLDASSVTGNTSTNRGGGISNAPSCTATLLNGSRVSGNTALQGGGIVNDGTLTLDASTITANLAAGGIFNTGIANLQNGTDVSGNTGGNCLGPGDYNPDLNPDGSNAFCAA